MSKLGQVSNVQPMAGELLAWTMLINGQPQVVFTTKDEKVVITGNAFDTATMDSVSLPILQKHNKVVLQQIQPELLHRLAVT